MGEEKDREGEEKEKETIPSKDTFLITRFPLSQTYKWRSTELKKIPRGRQSFAFFPVPSANPAFDPTKVVTFSVFAIRNATEREESRNTDSGLGKRKDNGRYWCGNILCIESGRG